jgi:hypothetical protein
MKRSLMKGVVLVVIVVTPVVLMVMGTGVGPVISIVVLMAVGNMTREIFVPLTVQVVLALLQ